MQFEGRNAMGEFEPRLIGSIPVRNIWLLFLYASNLAQFYGRYDVAVEEAPDFPSLVGRLLCFAVDRRLTTQSQPRLSAKCCEFWPV